MRKRAFTLVELLSTVVIMSILTTMIFVYIPDYTQRTSALVLTKNIETLNTALENYKVQGGMEYSHSLAGGHLNTTAGNQAIFEALCKGFTLQDVHLKFLDGSFKLSPGSVKAIGSGKNLYFESGTPDS
jgi:prepilin-type N-terminal cleavage/methylation domain-containing protein